MTDNSTQARKRTLGSWIAATRPWSFPASAMPVAASVAWLFWNGAAVNWWHALWALLTIIMFHAAGNTWSDYFDYRQGVDTPNTFGSKTLTSGAFTPTEIKKLSLALLAIASLSGTAMLFATGLPLLCIGLGGLFCTMAYPWLKFHAWGDAVILVTYGLLPTVGTVYVVSGHIDWSVLWLAVPIALITVGILHANNTRDIETDQRANIRTFAMNVGADASVALYNVEVILPFLWVGFCIVCGTLPIWSLLVLPALAMALKNAGCMNKLKAEGTAVIAQLDERTAQLQLVFSLLLVVSLFTARLVA